MRILTIFLCIVFISFSGTAQNKKDLVYLDRERMMLEFEPQSIYLDTLSGRIIIISEVAKADRPSQFADYNQILKIINVDGTVDQEINFFEDYYLSNVQKVEGGYLFVVFYQLINGVYGSYFKMMKIDNNFNKIYEKVINLGSVNQKVENPFAGVFGTFYSGRDTLYAVYPIEYRDTIGNHNIFAVLKFDHSGNYMSYSKLPKVQGSYSRIGMKPIVEFPNDTNYLLMQNSDYYNKVSKDFSTLEEYRVPINTRNMSSTQSFGNYFYTYGANISFDAFDQYLTYSISKLDTNFALVDSIQLEFPFKTLDINPPYSYYSYDIEIPPGCFYMDEDGNFNVVSYINCNGIGEGIINEPGRINVVKFTPDLQLLCKKEYEVPNWKVNVNKGFYMGDGQLLIAGSMDTIEKPVNRVRHYHPFIGIVRNGCDIAWAKEVSQLGTLVPEPLPGNISISPNPSSNYIKIDFTGDGTKVKTIKFFNAMGELMDQSPYVVGEEVFIKDLPKGVYFVQLVSDDGRSIVGNFIKQ